MIKNEYGSMLRIYRLFVNLLAFTKGGVYAIVPAQIYDMANLRDQLTLVLLRVLTKVKRAVLWLWGGVTQVLELIGKLYSETVGFWLYKRKFFSLRKAQRLVSSSPGQIADMLGKRSVLQGVFFIGVVILLIPHSKIYSQENQVVVGRQTLLYRVVGPGDEIQEIEDVDIDLTLLAQKETRSYREGAIVSEVAENPAGAETVPEVDLASISAGGQALQKPTIISGTDVIDDEILVGDVPEPKRTASLVYEVQPGDVIGNIAAKYGLSVSTILWANDLRSNSYIRPGDTLTILPVDGVVHTVKSGDTVSRIARTYDSSVADIIAYNRLQDDGQDIAVGEPLIIPDGVKPQVRYTPPAATSQPSAARTVAAAPPSVTAPAGTAYLWPTSVRTITQYYGWRHTGVDIAGPFGTPLYATKAGKVIKSQCGWNGGYGCYIIIDHGGGVTSLYAHINGANGLLAGVGEQVKQGQTIGLMGSSGRSTGPHIHFEIRVNGKRKNPFQYVK